VKGLKLLLQASVRECSRAGAGVHQHVGLLLLLLMACMELLLVLRVWGAHAGFQTCHEAKKLHQHITCCNVA
jgi:hypothetical protein